MDKNQFKNPDKKFSPYCFWFANDEFEKAHIVDMAKKMENKGLSPGYLQDRGIKKNKFLSKGFFDTLKAVLNNTDIPMGLCDEVGGMYGGSAMTEDMPLGESLCWEILKGNTVPDCFCAVACQKENGKIITESLKEVYSGDKIPENMAVYCFHKYHKRSLSGSEINYLNRKSSDIVIKEVYEKIKDNLGGYFGNKISGIFMDLEGDFGYKLAYSDMLKESYQNLFNESFVEILPLLFEEDTDGRWMRARYRYFTAAAKEYSVFFEKIADWCSANNVEFTGHTWEENLYGQVLQEGDFYEIQKNFSVVGVDSLRLDCCSPRDFKEAQTIADKENKGFMCEALGCAGWSLSPEEIKRAVNCMTTWGINHMVLHGVYTDRDISRMGFAPDFYEINPYWEYFNQISDYIKRTSYINSIGKMCADTVLFNPIDSVKALVGDMVFDREQEFCGYIIEQRDMLRCSHGLEIKAIEESYNRIIEELTDKRVQFYVFDEVYFNEDSFENIQNIIIPQIAFISKKLLKKLILLSEQGKNICFFGDMPYASAEEGKNDPEIFELIGKIKNIKHELDFESEIKIISENFNLKASHRGDGRTHYFWLYNDTEKKQKSVIELTGVSGIVSLLNCETGEEKAVFTQDAQNGIIIHTEFAPYEGYWIKVCEPEKILLEDFVCVNTEKLLCMPNFTGKVLFKTTFNLVKSGKVILSTDSIYHIAEVFINGKSAGARLWKPYTWDISELVCEGENTVEIAVGNLVCSSLKEYGDKWQTGIHRRNPLNSYKSGIDGEVNLFVYC